MAMFPPALPHVLVECLTSPGDVVYDPFAGRGTSPFEACLRNRAGLGSDANPLAVVLTGAKVDPPTRTELQRRLNELSAEAQVASIAKEPAEIKMLFSRRTLGQLVWLKSELNLRRRADRFLMAVLLGSLHRNASVSGRPLGLTVAMPNTFAMSPGYVERYIEHHRLQPPAVDVFDFLKSKIDSVTLPDQPFKRGRAWRADASRSGRWPKHYDPAKLVVSSPPYLEVIKYGKYNWIRLWLLGMSPRGVDDALFASGSVPLYLEFMKRALSRTSEDMREDGIACFVIGDVLRGEYDLNLAERVADQCVPDDLRVMAIVADQIPLQHKVTRIWGDGRGDATRTDRLLILGARHARVRSLKPVRWELR
jgi:site-specific DNA-methyltransferase (adenine-specific)